ncbi:hypothetical protein, partial [Moorena sp. SIO3I8]|uniref:hypothetical protein n=1 Tax=Moorena sp. SIO3I8 TaxID=2607833 RepID=UPI0025D1F3E1
RYQQQQKVSWFLHSSPSLLKINVSIQLSAFSGQWSVVSSQLWHRLPACDLTQIKPMLTCFIKKHLK